jgi:hypothetical protein
MALYTDPVTGKPIRVDGPLVREPRGGMSSMGWIALLAVLIIGGVLYSNYYVAHSVDRSTSTVVSPVTSPSDPNASPVHPAPSPNPGP